MFRFPRRQRSPENRPENAKVYLIGAGPGDPGLLTLRGAACLGKADVVLYDGLCNPSLLAHAPQAEKICVGKHGRSRIWKQDEVIAEMLRHAKGGRCVARLKGGDPAVFARTAEEAEALQTAGIPFEIIPGITAALAAGSYAGIPVTHRKLASAVALVTGHEEPGKPESALDWDALARFPGTLVIYMGVTTADQWTSALLSAGKPADTPAAIIRRCSLADQQTIHCRLDEVAGQLTPASKLRPPVIVVLGPVTQLAETLGWFSTRPLFGQRIVVTRPEASDDVLGTRLREAGAEVLYQPAIEIAPPEDWFEVDAALDDFGTEDFVIFTSRHGLRMTLDRLFQRGLDAREFYGVKIAVVGAKTAAALRDYGLTADVVPEVADALHLAEALRDQVGNQRCYLFQASRAEPKLAELLTAAGAQLRRVVAYRHSDVDPFAPEIVELFERPRVDWVTVTSSAIARSIYRQLGEKLHGVKLASLSPVTSNTLGELGLSVAVEANVATMDGLAQAILQAASSPSQLNSD